MLKIEFTEDCITCKPGPSVECGPTRYGGEYWDRIASDLLCGVADVFPDVGILHIGEPGEPSWQRVKSGGTRWAEITDHPLQGKSVWGASPVFGWFLVPNCREAVEEVMSWTMPAPLPVGTSRPPGSCSVAFSGLHWFRNRLDSERWGGYDEKLHGIVQECAQHALFTMRWAPTAWSLYPGKIIARQLLRLIDPVVSRINSVTSEE